MMKHHIFIKIVIIFSSQLFVSCGQLLYLFLLNENLNPTYTIQYSGNGNTSGKVPKDNKTYHGDDTAYVMENSGNLQKTGYLFGGWSYRYVEKVKPGKTISVSDDLTLKARWVESAFVFDTTTGTILDYNLVDEDVVIPTQISGVSVVTIGEQAFSWEDMKTVVLPNTLKNIGNYAFHANQIATLILPSLVESIGVDAFARNKLKQLTVPGSVQSIESGAFASNELTTVQIYTGLTNIGSSAFQNNKLTDISIPPTVSNVGKYAFKDNLIMTITLPSNTVIDSQAFANNEIILINIGSNVSILETTEPSSTEYTMGSHGNSFLELYINNGRMEGAYKYVLDNWILQ